MRTRILRLLLPLCCLLLCACTGKRTADDKGKTAQGNTKKEQGEYTKEHHSYEELLEYARSLDPQASVSEDYEDVTENSREYRIWPAVINGIDCSVASESKNVYNEGIAGGEFAETMYRMDTDYDFYVICEVLEAYPELGSVTDDSVSYRFQTNDIIASTITADSITDSELDELWDSYRKMNAELEQYPLHKAYWLELDISGRAYYMTDTEEETFREMKQRMSEDGRLADQ